MRRLVFLLAFALLALPATASAAQLIDRNATGVQIRTNAKGEALLTYHKGGAVKHILVWGAINAQAPTAGGHQAKFQLDYSGGWGRYHSLYWKSFNGGCGRDDGPALSELVAAVQGRCRPSSPPARPQPARTGLHRAGRSRCRTSASRPGRPSSARTGSRCRTGAG